MKTYLGDGVSVEWVGVGLVLTTDNGHRAQRIVLEPPAYTALVAYVEQLRARVRATAPRKAAQGE